MTALKCFLLDNGYTSQSAAPCCHMNFTSLARPEGPIIDSFSKLHSDKRYIEIKQSMDSGVWHKDCTSCRVVEEVPNSTIESKRQSVAKYFHAYPADDKTNVGLVDLTLAPGFLCNLQCRSCSPILSSSWINEKRAMSQALGLSMFPYNDEPIRPNYNYHNDDWSNVRYVTFLGGEPLYNPEFYIQLEKVANDTGGNCIVSIVTNCTVRLDLKKYHWLNKFKNVNLVFSIDSIGRSFEFIRTGANWDKVVKNIQFYKSIELFKHGCSSHVTNSILNILEMSATLDCLESMGVRDSGVITHVTAPAHLTYSVLTDQEKQEIIKRLTNTRSDYNIPVLLDSPHNPTNRANFLLFMEHTKNYHGMDWKDYLPDLYNIMNET